ncbi:MAG TPA: NAD(P)H-hydrate dehydratase [Candidatus Hydrogenedentes bacterium]|nr:NAD(P)H-hydrate dehydratase [Candidatus Hydrogenedentota bacterium]
MAEVTTLTRELVASWLPPRPRDAHKGIFGHLLVAAGSRGMTGAAFLACDAAQRSGVGLVTLAVPTPLADIAAARMTETMTLPCPASSEDAFASNATQTVLDALSTRNALALGPGLSRHTGAIAFARSLARRAPVPAVIDADALWALAETGPFAGFVPDDVPLRVLTPHPGEMARLTGRAVTEIQADRVDTARRYAARWHGIVVLKGHGTVIAAPDGRCYVCPRGGSGLARGGSGDVLTGITGALLAQGVPPMEAAAIAVFTHATAGDLLEQAVGARGMTAGDLVRALPWAWREIESGEPASSARGRAFPAGTDMPV